MEGRAADTAWSLCCYACTVCYENGSMFIALRGRKMLSLVAKEPSHARDRQMPTRRPAGDTYRTASHEAVVRSNCHAKAMRQSRAHTRKLSIQRHSDAISSSTEFLDRPVPPP